MLKTIKHKLLINLQNSLFCALTLLFSSQSYAAITAGTATALSYSNDDTTFILPHTVIAGSDRLLLVGISFQNNSFQKVTGVNYGGTTALKSAVISSRDNDSRVEIWSVLLGTDSGSQSSKNITVVFDNQIRRGVVIGAISFSGVHQTLPYYSESTKNGKSTTPNLNVSSKSDEVVFAVAAQEQKRTLLAPTGLWSKLAINSGDESLGAGAIKNGVASSVVMSWTGEDDDWAVAGLSILATGATLPPTKTCVTNPLSVNNQDVNAISGSSDTNIIAVADNTGGSGQISIFNGTSWTLQTDSDIPDEDFNDVFVFDSNNAVVVGDDGAVVLQVNGDWVDISISNQDYETIWAYAKDDIFIAGDNGRIYHYDGSNWSANLGSGSNNDDFVDSWGDATYVYFLNDDGDIFRYNKSSPFALNPTSPNPITPNCSGNIDLNGFTSDGAGNFYLFGENATPNPDSGVIFKWDGVNAWTTNTCTNVFQTSSTDDINAITINNGTFTAVGDDGVVVTSTNGTSWAETTLGSEDINAVYTLSNGTIIYGADDDGTGNGSNQICTIDKPHLSISHDGAASSCTAEAITISVHDRNHNLNTTYTGTVTISTSTSKGDWSVNDTNGTFQNNGNGSATYTFVTADAGNIVLNLTNTAATVLSINLKDDTTPDALTDFISEDPILTVSGPAAETLQDTFSSQQYNNTNGSLDWSSISWLESDAAGAAQSPTEGNALITGNELRINTSGTSVTRTISISTYASAVLTFTYDTRRADSDEDYAVVEISSDGTTFSSLQTYNGSQNGSFNQSIPVATTHIRFRVTAGYNDGGERFEVDNVKIAATPLSSCLNTIDHIRIEHDGEGLTCDKEQVTVKACTNATCTTEYTANVTAKLTPDGDTVTFSGNTTAYVRQSTAVAATLGATITSTPTPLNSVRCFNGTTETCTMNFVNSGFRFTDGANPPSPITIGTQVAGKASNVNPGTQTIALQAVRTGTTGSNAGSCVGVFADGTNINVEMASQCNDPIACIATSKVSITNNASPTVTTPINNNPNAGVTSYSSVPLRFTTNSQAILNFAYPDVGQITLHARYNILDSAGTTTGNYMSGNSNAFVVKPSTFIVKNILRADDTANPANTTGTATPYFVKAGTSFKATIEAHDINGNVTPNYGNEKVPEGVLLTPTLVTGLGLTNNPAIANNTIAGTEFGSTGAVNDANGVASVINLNWPEVGIITITPSVADADYLGIGTVAGTATGNVGRFVPDHFDTLVTHACNSFTYSSQPFIVTVTSRNNAGGVTGNYRGNFAHGVTLSDANPAGTPTGSFANNTISSTSFSSNLATNGGAFGVGSTEAANNFTYKFTTKESVPDVLDLRATDLIDTSISSNGFAEGTTEVRSGRMRLENSFGSELVDMAITAQVEYFSSATNNYVINPLDTCTKIDVELTDLDATDQIILGDGDTDGNGETCIWDDSKLSSNLVASTDFGCITNALKPQFKEPLTNGSFNLYLKAPGAAKTGDIGIKLLSTPAWLQNDRDGDGNPDGDPTGTASFGLYRGDDRIIYWREVFN